nr:uncharacterized protein LOC125184438 isoform X2 [Anser cygnoides]
MGGVMSPCLRPAPPAQAPASSLGCAGRFLCFGGNRAGRGNVPCVGQGTGLQRARSPGRGLRRGPQVMRVDTGIQMGAAPPGAPSSPGCPQLPRVPPSPSGPHLPWVLWLWSRHRAGEACRGQQVPARRARGGQSRAVSLNAPRRARRRGGRAWPSPGMGTLLGGGSPHCGRLLCHRCGQHPRASPQGIQALAFWEHRGGKRQLRAVGEDASNEGGCDFRTKCLKTLGNWQLLVSKLFPVCPHPGAAQPARAAPDAPALLAQQTPPPGWLHFTHPFALHLKPVRPSPCAGSARPCGPAPPWMRPRGRRAAARSLPVQIQVFSLAPSLPEKTLLRGRQGRGDAALLASRETAAPGW